MPLKEKALLGELRDYYSHHSSTFANTPYMHAYIERLVPLAPLEISIHGVDDRFDVGHFTQELEGAHERGAWQVAYDEALLSPDGLRIISRRSGFAAGIRDGRIAFYFHYYDYVKPMQWTYGHFNCPTVQPISKRLRTLVPYYPVD